MNNIFNKIRFAAIFFCSFSILSAQSGSTVVEKLPEMINTPYHETAPVLSRDAQTLYFTRIGDPDFNRTLIEKGKNVTDSLDEVIYLDYLGRVYKEIGGKTVKKPVYSSAFNQDVWVCELVDGTPENLIHPPYPLNSALPNSVCSVTPFGRSLVVLNQFPEEGGMKDGYSMVQKLNDSTWSFPEPITIQSYYNLQSDVNMTMSVDGSFILFSMARHDSRGSKDLYVSIRGEGNNWGPPISLGQGVNTTYNETAPHLSADSKTVYFSSDRPGSFGGKDLYMIKRLDETWRRWTQPFHLRAPINSEFDDTHPCFNAATGMLYYSSDREGSSDIYRVQVSPPNPITVPVKGYVINRVTNELMSAKIVSGPEDDPIVRNVFISEDGTFNMEVPKGSRIKIFPERTGYMSEGQILNFANSFVPLEDFETILYLTPLEEGMKVSLPPIYFEKSKPVILTNSFEVLDELALFLEENPSVNIRIEGHTDNIGDEQSLQFLSEQRAEAIKAYLEEKGIDKNRVETVGYGSTKPVNDNSTEDRRKANRRVEVIITKK